MHRIWQIPELLAHIISFLPAADINRSFQISHHFANLLKSSLPPQLRPLPESRSTHSSGTQALPQDVIDKASAYLADELAMPKQPRMEDSWCKGTQGHILDALKPCLHPLLAKSVTRLDGGFGSLAGGSMDVCFQTDVPYQELYVLVHGKEKRGWDELLGTDVKGVTVFCLGGVQWDLLYSGVRYRDSGGVQRFSVRIERVEGVRLGDAMEELAGTLVMHGMSGGLGQDVTLLWRFGDN